jgi:hypothetical protein
MATDKKAIATCRICGKPLTNAESVASGIGPICDGKDPKVIAQRMEELSQDAIPQDYVPLSRLVQAANERDIATSRVVRAFGGDRGLEDPIDPVFALVYVQGRRYVHKDALLVKNLTLIANLPRRNAASTNSKPKAKRKTAAEKKTLKKANKIAAKSVDVEARKRRQQQKQGA